MTTNYLKILKQNWQAMILFTASLVILATIVSLLQPFEYRARVNLLIIQKQTATLDAYGAARASQSLAANFATVVKTDSFFKKVIASNQAINVAWPIKEDQRRETWNKMIGASVAPETGILSLNVYQKDPDQAKIIANTVASVLAVQGSEYHGGGDSVSIKIVDPALVSNYPVRPNLIFNIIGAFLIGLILSGSFFLWREQKNISELVSEVDQRHNHNHNKINQREIGRVKHMLSEPLNKQFYFEDIEQIN
jgi:capsular polysaccharide biosynthesis protein